jgi:GntR family transcriptional regulator
LITVAAGARGRLRVAGRTYEPGQRLPSIVDLIQEYGVARLTANTALRLLVTEGLAVLSPGMGFYVRTDIGQN